MSSASSTTIELTGAEMFVICVALRGLGQSVSEVVKNKDAGVVQREIGRLDKRFITATFRKIARKAEWVTM